MLNDQRLTRRPKGPDKIRCTIRLYQCGYRGRKPIRIRVIGTHNFTAIDLIWDIYIPPPWMMVGTAAFPGHPLYPVRQPPFVPPSSRKEDYISTDTKFDDKVFPVPHPRKYCKSLARGLLLRLEDWCV